MRVPLASALITLASLGSSGAATFTVVNANATGPGSLYEAITNANASSGRDEIGFNIPGDGVHKIDIRRLGLPEVTEPITIDGYTQPSARANTQAVGNDALIRIQIDAGGGSSQIIDGLVISAGDCIVRGLSITGVLARVYFSIDDDPEPLPPPDGDAIVLKTGGGNVIEGNFIGVAPSGVAETDNFTYRGVHVLSDNNRIGGTAPGSRNVISRHYTAVASSGLNTVIEGNYIGTDASGTRLPRRYVGNGAGVSITNESRIGGTEPGSGNVIAGSQTDVYLGSNNVVQGNRFGAGLAGSDPLESLSRAISVFGSRNLIGGLMEGAANTIAYSTSGIDIAHSAIENTILSNLYLSETHRAISLSAARNDLGDADEGPNRLQNYPVLTKIEPADAGTYIEGGINSSASETFLLQFYYYNHRENRRTELVTAVSVTTNEFGGGSFALTVPARLGELDSITATATDLAGNTSGFIPFGTTVQLANLSTRGHVGTEHDILIGGFIVRQPYGWQPYPDSPSREFQKRVLIRALGSSLSAGGAPVDGSLENPTVELRDSDGHLIAQNDDWRESQGDEIAATGAAPSHESDAAIIAILPEGSFTAQVRGRDGQTGLGIVEVYDLDPLARTSGRLINIATRGRAGTAENLLIGGIIINGDAAQRVMARAIGADLAAVGLPDALMDPVLELRDASGTLLAFNDNWKDSQQAEVESTRLIPTNEQNSAIITTLIPGLYTTIVRGKNDTTGLAVVEFYDLNPQ